MNILHSNRRWVCVGMAAAFAVVLSVGSSSAETLSELLPDFLDNHNLSKAAQADVTAAGETALAAKGGWYPALNVTITGGSERQNKPTGTDPTNMVSREADFTVTQRLWDGDATNSAIRTANLSEQQAKAIYTTTRSGLLLRAFSAYANVIRAAEGLNYAQRSEQNIKKQTELEDALVKRGAGFSTDVLQAKVQLAGAQARRVRAEGGLAVAMNAYRGVFSKDPGPADTLIKPVLPVDLVPVDVDEAVKQALTNNAFLVANNLTSQIAMETVNATRASSYSPTIDGIVDWKHKKDVSATAGYQQEVFAKVQLSFPFNLGFTAINTLKATEDAHSAANYRYADAKTSIEEATRNAWEQLKTAKSNAELLRNQANIAAEFLEFARKERTLGRRSLLDVLSGETALINSSSDAASAEIDIAIAVFTLLDAMGELDEDALTR
ncbi:MAG: TolC family protein, partial [Rhodospirillaceae bacterium]|nr:TolC family protein [Rhodospirillaceae bacterium]